MNEPRQKAIVAIVQARLTSVRFPRKILSELGGQPVLQFLLGRLALSHRLTESIVAIPDNEANDPLETLIRSWGFQVFRGSESDVLSRYAGAAEQVGADVVVRITGDCPLIDPQVIDQVIDLFDTSDGSYVRTSSRFPDGFDVEVMTRKSLDSASDNAAEAYDREHVTPWIQRANPGFPELTIESDCSDLRITLDEPEDLTVIRAILGYLGKSEFGLQEVIDLLRSKPELVAANRHLVRNEGASMGAGEKLWRRAQRVIPGGTMLLSKRPDQFLPKGWPTYYSKAKGCEIWDLDGKRYFDLSLMGVGTNILGYGHPKVDEAVRRTIEAGNLSTLNCPEEVLLAEKLCEIHPWAEMAKFARSGGEACAIAVRIARAASGKPAVAVCGYHGWHDWYLSANLADDQALDGHLLPGLTPNGVPRNLLGLTRPFFYNDLEALREILKAGDVGAVIMEVERSSPPIPGFLEGVRELTRSHGTVLIFDECTSGFRLNLGGLHLTYGIEPDIATFGKTLGNGYAITAVIGRREVMESATSTFISSTFWTERIGPTAALATLEVMEEEDAPHRINEIGVKIRSIWEQEFPECSFDLKISGLPALTVFEVRDLTQYTFKSTLTSEMLKRNFLSSAAVYTSIAHTENVLDMYRASLGPSLKTAIEQAGNIASLDSPSSQPGHETSGFGRLA